MRILMVSEDLPAPGLGGLARHTLALSRALIDAGHQVDLMGNDDYPPGLAEGLPDFGGRFFPELHGQFDGWKEISLGVFMPPKRSVIARRFARAILKRADDYDVVHYHGHLPNIARYLPRALNFIQTRHDQGSDCLIHTRFARGQICARTEAAACAGCRSWHPNFLQRQISALAAWRFRREVKQSFLRHKTVFVSDFLRHRLRRTFGMRDWGVTVHNFIDTHALHAASESMNRQDSATDSTLNASREHHRPLKVFIAAKLYPAKGVGALLNELDALGQRAIKAISLSVAGDGPEEAALRESFRWVHFHGWQSGEQTLQLAARAEAIVVPSVCEEACASTVLEALMLGKTVFALRLGGTPELAVYASDRAQLQLFDDMRSLAAALVTFRPNASTTSVVRPAGSTPARRADAAHAAHRLLELYRLPPGPLVN